MWLVGLLVKTDTFEIHNALDGNLALCSTCAVIQIQCKFRASSMKVESTFALTPNYWASWGSWMSSSVLPEGMDLPLASEEGIHWERSTWKSWHVKLQVLIFLVYPLSAGLCRVVCEGSLQGIGNNWVCWTSCSYILLALSVCMQYKQIQLSCAWQEPNA